MATAAPHVSASLETRDGGMVEEFSGGEKPFRHVCSAKGRDRQPTPHQHTDIQTNNNDKNAEIHKELAHLHNMPSSAWRIQGAKPADSDTNIYSTEIWQMGGLAGPVCPNFQQRVCTLSRTSAL